MSRAQQNSPAGVSPQGLRVTARRRVVAVAALAIGLGVAVAGCGAGQITQTDTQVASVNGASGQLGRIAVRDAQLAFPASGDTFYSAKSNAPLIVTIANNGETADRLVSVTSDASDAAIVVGTTDLPGGVAVQAGVDKDDSTASSARPSSSAPSLTSTPSAPSSGSTPSSGSSVPSGSASSAPSGSASASSVVPTSSTVALPVGKIRITLPNLSRDVRSGQNVKVKFVFEKAGTLELSLPIGAPADPRSSHA
ncbi:copper chaperone PCu(A)C [Solihabitans fulvus]|uniref:Copper chaperone PCu(A)C n=1 Tax=Solihabitans fulvus TaxID=1892852 RepID=A0A5B2XHR2_9PSEU|nr:copper chaperone PCu(A)C [Solihabitans fulvus]KAA2262360.1 copper chaperone PCu(A)C [Solihabitans fulvus]